MHDSDFYYERDTFAQDSFENRYYPERRKSRGDLGEIRDLLIERKYPPSPYQKGNL